MIWEPSKVGCYWNSGDFHIATRVAFENGREVLTWPKSGYVLTRKFVELGIFKTLKAAQRAAKAFDKQQEAA